MHNVTTLIIIDPSICIVSIKSLAPAVANGLCFNDIQTQMCSYSLFNRNRIFNF